MKKLLIILLPAIAALFTVFLAGVLYGRSTAQATAPLRMDAVSVTENAESQKVISGKININTATKEDLLYVPGIGDVLAQRIIDYRETNGPFVVYEDLENVSGIGPKKLEQLSEYLTAGG